ncbi:10532_t:CDS:2, partial [Racocetra persica]
ILSEIELFWMLPYQRRKKNWFPEIIYYTATIEELQKYIQKLQSENFEESSKPFIFSHIYKIADLDTKTVDEKLNDLDEKLKNLDIKLNNLIVTH